MMLCLQKTGPNEKPLQLSNKNKKLQRVILLAIIFGLFCLLLMLIISTPTNKLLFGNVDPDTDSNTMHFLPKCSTLQQFQICSHRLLEPPNADVPAGSTAAMTAFWQHGIRCFDIDAVTTKDGQLMAAHPAILGPKISTFGNNFDPSAYTLDEMRRLGVDEEGHPLLETILEHYATLLHNDETANRPYYSEHSDIVQGSLFHLDLKGPHLTAQHLKNVQDKILKLGIQNNVSICAGALKDGEEIGPPGIDILQQLGQDPSKASMCLVLRDREEDDSNVDRVREIVKKNKAIRSYASSYKFEKNFFLKLKGMPMILWTIDNEETLKFSIESGAAGVVTNHPMMLQDMLQGWIKNGQCDND